jgi:hypothetical protein
MSRSRRLCCTTGVNIDGSAPFFHIKRPPRAPFDPGRFSVDQITLSDLEERSGLDFDKLKDFDVLAAQPIPKSVLEGAPLRLPLRTVREAVLWAP